MLEEPHTLTTQRMAERMAEPGVTVEFLATQIRGFAQRDYITCHGHMKGSGRTAHRLYSESMMAQAKLLSILTDFGFSDPSIMQAAATACSSPVEGRAIHPDLIQGGRVPTPMQAALRDFRLGGWPSFEMTLRRHDQTGERKITAQIVASGLKRIPIEGGSDGYAPLASVAILLQKHFVRMFANREGMN